jgi:predicted permease
VALCLVLLVGAGLFLQSLRRGLQLDPGFDSRRLVLAGFDVFPVGYDRERALAFYDRVLERMRGLPGVQQAALARTVPLGFGGNSSTGVAVDGYEPRRDEEVVVSYNEVSDGYFETMRIPIVSGRGFTRRDTADAPAVVVVNQTMAGRYWRDANPVGRFIRIGKTRLQVVGIARDGKYRSLSERPAPYMYFPLAQSYRSAVRLHVRTAADPAATIDELRQAMHELDPELPVTETITMDQHMEEAVFAQRIGATLLSIFGALALTLAAVGLYSVMAYAVSQRTRELGIRLALGATPRELRRMVVSGGMKLAGVGLAVGAAGAVGVSRLLTSLLNGVSPADPATFGGVLVLLGAVAFVAALVPARRASAVDPIVALRYE